MTKRKYEKHGNAGTKLYKMWSAMIQRCHNPNNQDYSLYGEKGIKVADEFRESFIAFKEFALEKGYKEGLDIDRISNLGGYTRGNIRFVTHKENCRNKSRHRYIDDGRGNVGTIAEWSEKTGIKQNVLCERIRYAKTLEQLFRPVRPYKRRKNTGS